MLLEFCYFRFSLFFCFCFFCFVCFWYGGQTWALLMFSLPPMRHSEKQNAASSGADSVFDFPHHFASSFLPTPFGTCVPLNPTTLGRCLC